MTKDEIRQRINRVVDPCTPLNINEERLTDLLYDLQMAYDETANENNGSIIKVHDKDWNNRQNWKDGRYIGPTIADAKPETCGEEIAEKIIADFPDVKTFTLKGLQQRIKIEIDAARAEMREQCAKLVEADREGLIEERIRALP